MIGIVGRALLLLATLATLAGMSPPVQAAPRVQFSISGRVAEDDAAYVREGIAAARAFVERELGWSLEDDLIVNVRPGQSPGVEWLAGFTGPGFIAIFTGAPGWAESPPALRVQVAAHEFVHVRQGAAAHDPTLATWPTWLVEGMADYVAFVALAQLGILDLEEAIGAQQRLAADDRSSVPDLAGLTDRDAFYEGGGIAYAKAAVAVARLVRTAGVESIGRFLDRVEDGTPWASAFHDAFGWEPDRFAAEFERWFASDMRPPAALPRGFVPINPAETRADAEILSAPRAAEPGDQIVVMARADTRGVSCHFSVGNPKRSLEEVRATADMSGAVFLLRTLPPDTPPGALVIGLDCGGTTDSVTVSVSSG